MESFKTEILGPEVIRIVSPDYNLSWHCPYPLVALVHCFPDWDIRSVHPMLKLDQEEDGLLATNCVCQAEDLDNVASVLGDLHEWLLIPKLESCRLT